MSILLVMLNGLRDTDFIVHHITLGLWSQEMQDFLRMTWLVGVINFQTLGMKGITVKLNPLAQVIDWLSFTPLKHE